MKLTKLFFSYLHKQTYIPDVLGIFINPLFIVRFFLFFHLKKFFSIIRGKTLDFGCGQSPYKDMLADVTYYGLEYEKYYHRYSNSGQIYFYDGKRIPFEDSFFDSIICTEVLEHVPNVDEIVQEFKRVLKTKGYILISVPFVWNEHELPHDYQRFTENGIKLLFEKNGFNVICTIKTTNSIHSITQLITNEIHHRIFTKNYLFNFFLNFVFIFPVQLIGLIVGFLIPDKKKRLPLNIVLLAQKI